MRADSRRASSIYNRKKVEMEVMALTLIDENKYHKDRVLTS